MLGALQKQMHYSTLIGIYPGLHSWLFYPLSILSWSGARGTVRLRNFVSSIIDQRARERAAIDVRETKTPNDDDDMKQGPQDFLEKLMTANEKDPTKVRPDHFFMMSFSNVNAGSDTTAASLSGILYYLLKYPSTYLKLRQEIDQFKAEGKCGHPNITFKESQEMSYLQAVIKEGLRLHPATGLPLWRVVPEGGADISGKFFPAGTVVGINSWTAHYNKDIWGPDAEVFRPERWINADKSSLSFMESYYMPVSLSSRLN